MSNFSITDYPDVPDVTRRLDALVKLSVCKIRPDALTALEHDYYDAKCPKSKELAALARERIPGGNQHNLAGSYPFPMAFAKSEGAYLYDLDGNEYYDFMQTGGSSVLGGNPPSIREKVVELLNTCGPSTGLFHEYEYKLADKICELVPSVQMFRMLGSGTEACMAAIRVSRLATGKKKILRMGGACHGWSDQLAYGINIPGSRWLYAYGIPRFCFEGTREFFPDDLSDLESKLQGGNVAAVIIEPLGPGSGTRPLSRSFNKEAEKLCRKYRALLIFDESVTAFRVGMSGAQGYFDVLPDLTIFGSAIAGGYPGAGGIGGKREYMSYLEQDTSFGEKGSRVFAGGCMTANPLSSAAGYHTICEIERTNAPYIAGQSGNLITQGLQRLISKYDLPFVAYNQGSVCHLETTGTMQLSINWGKPWQIPEILKHAAARKKESEYYSTAYTAEGLVMPVGGCFYTSASHTQEMIDDALTRFERVFQSVESPAKKGCQPEDK